MVHFEFGQSFDALFATRNDFREQGINLLLR